MCKSIREDTTHESLTGYSSVIYQDSQRIPLHQCETATCIDQIRGYFRGCTQKKTLFFFRAALIVVPLSFVWVPNGICQVVYVKCVNLYSIL